MKVDLEALLRLQEKDKVVKASEDLLESLEPKVEELDHALEVVSEQLALARKGAEDADTRRAGSEGRIEGYRIMQDRRRQRLEWVKGAKEASTIMAELDLARGVLAKEEAEWIRSADRLQEAQARVVEIEATHKEIEEVQTPLREEVAELETRYQSELADACKQRDKVALEIKPNMLAIYRRTLRGRAPLALYPLHDGACGHCFTSVPKHRIQQLRNGSVVEHCEACGVLLYNASTDE